MKILCGGDTHLTDKKPKNRTDDYAKTVMQKFNEELDIAVEEGCSVVILPGDVFNTSKENHYVVQAAIQAIMAHNVTVLGVAGQHDQHYHNPNLAGTALQTLIDAGVFHLLTEEPINIDGVHFYGSSWKGEIPEVSTPGPNVLVLHKMIVADKLWAAQENFTWANHMLLKTKYDLIVAGDNHTQFFASSKDKKHLVNMGSMMRSTIAQVNHKPAVTVYDTETREIEIIELTTKPLDTVMCIEKAEKEKEKSLDLEEFMKTLKDAGSEDGGKMSLDFVKELETYVENPENVVDDEVAEIIFSCLEAEKA